MTVRHVTAWTSRQLWSDWFAGRRSATVPTPLAHRLRTGGTLTAGSSPARARWVTAPAATPVKTHGTALSLSTPSAGVLWHNPRYSREATSAQRASSARWARVSGSVVRLRSMLKDAYRRRHAVALAGIDTPPPSKTLLEDAEWSQWSNSEIGRRCGGISHHLVGKMRPSLGADPSEPRKVTTKPFTVAPGARYGPLPRPRRGRPNAYRGGMPRSLYGHAGPSCEGPARHVGTRRGGLVGATIEETAGE